MKGIDLKNRILIQAGVNMQVVRITDIAELPVETDLTVQQVFDWARQQFNLEDDVCAYVPSESGTDVEVLRSQWAETKAPVESRLLFKPKAKPDGSGLDDLSYKGLQQLAKLHGITANETKALLVDALSAKGVMPNPAENAELVKLEGYKRSTDGIVIIPLDPTKAVTVEFYQKKAEYTDEDVSRVSVSTFKGMKIGDVKKKFGTSLLGIPSGLKKLFQEQGISYTITVDGEEVANDFVFKNGEVIEVKRTKTYPETLYWRGTFISEKFVGVKVDELYGLGDICRPAEVRNIFVNESTDPGKEWPEAKAGDAVIVIFSKKEYSKDC